MDTVGDAPLVVELGELPLFSLAMLFLVLKFVDSSTIIAICKTASAI
jgi:hypothetical protein